MTPDFPDDTPSLRELFPGLTDEELATAEENLDRYIAVIVRVHDRLRHDRLRHDPEAYARFKALTTTPPRP